MLGGPYCGDHSLYVRIHLQELQARAAEDRRARLARGPRPLRPRLGHLLVALGTALVGPLTEDVGHDPIPGGQRSGPGPSAPAPGPQSSSWPHNFSVAGAGHHHAADDAIARRQIQVWLESVRCAAVVGTYVHLDPHPMGYVGICPWAQHHRLGDSTAPLIVYTAIERWRCLATGESGTALDFVIRMERLPRAEALAFCLARWPSTPSGVHHAV